MSCKITNKKDKRQKATDETSWPCDRAVKVCIFCRDEDGDDNALAVAGREQAATYEVSKNMYLTPRNPFPIIVFKFG